ncbi:MAG: sulfotransferase [Myxococcales bacterium]|nr:sulfotransferase [Myxococcales bacterium]
MSHDRLQRFDDRWGIHPMERANGPVFVLAAGWRSGSTFLQRLLCSSGEVLIWGEPYGGAGLIPMLSRATAVLNEGWPLEAHFPPRQVFENLAEHWVANLYPPPQHLKQGLRALFDHWLHSPARAQGYERFGLKEVRLGVTEARMLAWLYPDARFVFLVRDPLRAWASAKGEPWDLMLPNHIVSDARGFALHWVRLTTGFLAWNTPNGMLIRYEDLIDSDFDFEHLARHCALQSIDSRVCKKKHRGLPHPPRALDASEVDTITQIAGPLLTRLDYGARTS